VRINCAALPLTLFEAELFGSEAGAFTGATGERRGLLEEASRGTVFLDEIGELPLEAQAKVLRALEDGAFFRVGGRKPVKVDVRFVAATNRDLAASVREGTFRADLYYRLNGITLHVPPLRNRPAEVLPLAGLFMRRAASAAGFVRPPALSSNAERRLFAYRWPGNVRELKNTMQRAVLLAGGDTIHEDHLLLDEEAGAGASNSATIPPPPPPSGSEPSAAPTSGLRSELDRRERERIDEALRACGGNQTRAAEMLGISRRTLISRLEKHKFARPLKK
jgi:transcriptional regulator with GAF, ATPase, and Fis domain